MKKVPLGSSGLEVSALGYGCMGLTSFYGDKLPDDEIITVLKETYRRGINFWDTANIYSFFDAERKESVCQEEIIGKAIAEVGRENIVIATKTGIKVEMKPEPSISACGDPAFVRKECEDSLRRLGVDSIDLFYLHRIDQDVPIEVTMNTLQELVKEGKIKHIGLSECSAKTLRRAHKVHPVTCIQVEWSLWCRGVEKTLVPTCAELGIGIVAYSPLGRGFFGSQKVKSQQYSDGDYRLGQDRLQGDALKENMKLLEKVEAIAASKAVPTAQVALAWLLHQNKLLKGAGVVPIPGSTKIRNIESNAQAVDLVLTPQEIEALEAIGTAAGERYSSSSSTWESDKNKELPSEEAAKYYAEQSV